MNFLQFIFRFGLPLGICTFAFPIAGALILILDPLQLAGNLLIGGLLLWCSGLLFGAHVSGWGFYIDGPEYFTIQPRNTLGERENQE